MSVAELERAIQRLSADEVERLMAWFEVHYHKVWDKQIEDDLEAGRLDALLADVDSEVEAGLTKPL